MTNWYRNIVDLLESTNDELVLYHGTSKESADNLLRSGWEPNKWSQGSQMGQKRFLYVTDVPENAQWYADEKDNGVVLKITNVPKEYLRVDPEDGIFDTVDEELNNQLPANLVITKPLSSTHFEIL